MVTIQITIGELIDRLSLLQIKKNHSKDGNEIARINEELSVLERLSRNFLKIDSIAVLYEDLLGVNLQIMLLENKIEDAQRSNEQGDLFVTAASMLHLQKVRNNIRNKINVLTASGT